MNEADGMLIYSVDVEQQGDVKSEIGEAIAAGLQAREEMAALGDEVDKTSEKFLQLAERVQDFDALVRTLARNTNDIVMRSGGNEIGGVGQIVEQIVTSLSHKSAMLGQRRSEWAQGTTDDGKPLNKPFNPQIDIPGLGEPTKATPFDFTETGPYHSKVPVRVPEMLIDGLTRLQDAFGKTIPEIEQSIRVTESNMERLLRRGELLIAHGDKNGVGTAHMIGGAGMAEILTGLKEALAAKQAIQGHYGQVDVGVGVMKKMHGTYEQINELDAREQNYRDRGLDGHANMIRKQRDKVIIGMEDTLKEADAFRKSANTKVVPEGYDDEVSSFGKQREALLGEVADREKEERDRAIAKRVADKGRKLITKIDDLKEDLDNAVEPSEQKAIRKKLKHAITTEYKMWRREFEAAAEEVDPDVMREEVGGLGRQLNGKRTGMRSRFGGEDRAEKAAEAEAAYERYQEREAKREHQEGRMHEQANRMNREFDQRKRKERQQELNDVFAPELKTITSQQKRVDGLRDDGEGLLERLDQLQHRTQPHVGTEKSRKKAQRQLETLITEKIPDYFAKVASLRRDETNGMLHSGVAVPAELGGINRQLSEKARGFTTKFSAQEQAEALQKQVGRDHGEAIRIDKARTRHLQSVDDFGRHVEGGIAKGEKRLVDVADGTKAKQIDFGNLKDDIADALKRGLIDQTQADNYTNRIKGVEGLQDHSDLKGQVERYKASLEELTKKMYEAGARADRLRANGDESGAKREEHRALEYSRQLMGHQERTNNLLEQLKMQGGLGATLTDLHAAGKSATLTGEAANKRLVEATGKSDDKLNTGGLGGWLRGELHRIPGGRYASALFGDQMAHAVNGGAKGMLGNFAASAAGQAIGRTTVGKAAMEVGKRAVGGATTAEGAAAITAIATNPITIGAVVAGVAAYATNKYANKKYEEGAGARQEEMLAGDIARRSGVRSRILDDVRQSDGQGGSGAIHNVYAKLGYSSGDVLNYVGNAGVAGLSDNVRQRTTLTGLRNARAHGLDINEMAGVQGDLKRGMTAEAANGGQLENDMNRFSLILSEAVKRGTGGPEMAQAFRGALGSATQLAGGKMMAATNDAFLSQMLSLQRSKDPYLSGANGVNTITNMNNTLGNIDGADRMFFYRPLEGKSAEDLGYEGEQAKTVQKLIEENPMLATGYILKNGTNESRRLMTEDIYKQAGGDVTTAQYMFQESGMDEVQASTAATKYAEQYKKYDGDVSKIRVDTWDAWQGRGGKGTEKEIADSFADVQKDNVNEGIARRQEHNYGEIKMRASHISFDTVTGQIAIQSVQSIKLGSQTTQKELQKELDGHAIGNGWRKSHTGDDVVGGNLRESPFRRSERRTEDTSPEAQAAKKKFEDSDLLGTRGFSSGGYTGGVGVGDIAGVVHGQEFVVNAQGTAQHRELLEHLNRGGSLAGYQRGGFAGGAPYRANSENEKLVPVLQDLTLAIREMKGGSVRRDLKEAMDDPQGVSGKSGFIALLKGGISGALNSFKNFFSGGSLFGGSSGGGGGTGSSSGGVSSGGAGGGSAEVSSIPTGAPGAAGSKIAATALRAVEDGSFISALNRCSMFVRQVTERSQGLNDYALAGTLFKDEARQSGLAWQQKGLTQTLDGAKKRGGLKEGDIVFQMSGSGDYDGDGDDGHIGAIVKDPKTGKLAVAENTTRGRGPNGGHGGQGAKMITPLENWGKVDLVGRYDGWSQPTSPSPTPGRTPAMQAATGRAASEQAVGRASPAAQRAVASVSPAQARAQAASGSSVSTHVSHSGTIRVDVRSNSKPDERASREITQAVAARIGGGVASATPSRVRARPGN